MLRNKKFSSWTGKSMYEAIVPKNHYLRKLNELADWAELAEGIFPCCKGEFQAGSSPLSPVTLLKMIFLSYLYDKSDRETERYCNENIPRKYFIEIAIDERAPDHSSLTRFRDRILRHYGGAGYFEKLFEKVVRLIAAHPDIDFGDSQIIDSSAVEAKVKRCKEKDEEPRDPDARTGCKGTEKKKDRDGKTAEIPKFFFGYKKHTSVENLHRFITGTIVTSGEKADNVFFQDLLWHDIAMRGMPAGYYADKGYDDGEHHLLLNELGIGDGIALRSFRFKDDGRYAIWKMIAESDYYKQKKNERYKVEAVFGDEKNSHGMRKCRYIGLVKTKVQIYMTDITCNLKKFMKVVFDISPRACTA